MKAIQMSMEADLVERVDQCVKRLGTTRSAFARKALREALERLERDEMEQRQISGYQRIPPKPQEFSISEADHAWGDGAWSEE